MRLLKRYLVSETARCLDNGVRLSVIGRRDRLSRDLVRTIENTERHHGRRRGAAPAPRRRLLGARGDRAKRRPRARSPEEFETELAAAVHSDVDAPVDLVDPHGRRAPLERLPALGVRVRRARVRRHVLARFRRSRVRRRAARIRAPRSALRPRNGNRRAGRLLARRVARAPLRAAVPTAAGFSGARVMSNARAGSLAFAAILPARPQENNNEGQQKSASARRSIPANPTSTRLSCSSRRRSATTAKPSRRSSISQASSSNGQARWQITTLGQSVPLSHAGALEWAVSFAASRDIPSSTSATTRRCGVTPRRRTRARRPRPRAPRNSRASNAAAPPPSRRD